MKEIIIDWIEEQQDLGFSAKDLLLGLEDGEVLEQLGWDQETVEEAYDYLYEISRVKS